MAGLAAAAGGAFLALTIAAGPADAVNDPGSPANTTIPVLPPTPPADNPSGHPTSAPGSGTTATISHDSGLDAESMGIGALGVLTLGAAGVGITYVVRRRHHTATPAA